MLEQFTNLYPVSKTLRFELIPIGKTADNIEKNGIIGTDSQLAESYKKMKKTIDEYHKAFIGKALADVSLTRLEDFYALYTASTEEKKSADFKGKYNSVKDALRKEIVKCFAACSTFKILDKKDLIQKELRPWIDANDPSLYFDENFRMFTTYFNGYNENRMNMYSSEEKATSIAHRLIDENLPKYIDNIRVFNIVKNTAVADNFEKLCSEMGIDSLDELFLLENYGKTLSQAQIDAYNGIIGGKSSKSGKIQGLNEYINLYNQTNPDKKIPKLKMLYKQILSERESLSWIPKEFGSANELLDAVKGFYDIYSDNVKIDLFTALENLPERELEFVYVSTDASVADISNRLFGYYGTLKNVLGIDDGKAKQTVYSVARIQTALDRYIADSDEESNPQLFAAYGKSCIASYFANEAHKADEKITTAYAAAEELLNTAHAEDYTLTQEDKNLIKTLLDGMMELMHTVKPLCLKADSELQKDDVFYGAFIPLFEKISDISKLYDKVRNFAAKKPYSTEKIKLNFDCSTLLDGWDVNKETQNLGVLLIKDGQYYLGIMDKNNNKIFTDVKPSKNANCYQKVMYKLLPGPNKMLPKVFFSNSRIDEFAPDKNILRIRDEETFKKGKNFSLSDCHALIDFYKASIAKHPDWSRFGFRFTSTEQYSDISEFYREVSEQGYKLSYMPIASDYIDSLVNDGKLYLFRIYNKDFSSFAKGKQNLHTMYWKALFDEENLSNVVYKLNGQAEIFYRKASIPDNRKIVHKANQPIDKKNPNLCGQSSTFSYDITKDRRFTVDKFQFHVPITMNFKADGASHINEAVCECVKNNPDVKVIGIDRGERHLLYISMIDRDGKVVKDKKGNYIQYSLNTISGEYKDSEGKAVTFETPYRELLDKKEKERKEARENWGVVENIKDLKSGYMSQVVHHIAKLMVEYNAVVALENLNSGFKNSRKKVEKQVYQNFEKALIDKLNYLVFKDKANDETGGLYKALQLTDKFESFKNLRKQSGFLFYVPTWNTSKIDPVTGFTDLLRPKSDMSIKAAKKFYSDFDGIRYNADSDYFEFSFDCEKFTEEANGSRTKWTVCTVGALRYAYNSSLNGGRGGYEKCNVTESLKSLFDEYGIDYRGGDLRDSICTQNTARFFAKLTKLLRVTLAIRYSCAEDGKDFILSPVADENGEFYCSEGRTDGLPQDADANGAFNIARKGLWVLRQIDKSKKPGDWTSNISNAEWLRFVQNDL